MSHHADTHAPALGLRAVSLALGVFFLFMGLDKVAWLMDGSLLTAELRDWLTRAPPLSRWYLETIAIPGAPVFARLVLAGELTVAAALLLGVCVRSASVIGIVMVLNFHVGMGVALRWDYLWNAYGPPVLGSLLGLAVGGKALPWSVTTAWHARSAHASDSRQAAAPGSGV
ncbi:MAG TPA: DoxX family membrane protein [Vicinamibacterales bacterium]